MKDLRGKLFLIGLAAFFAWQMWGTWQEKKASSNWPSTEARLLESHVRETIETREDRNGHTETSHRYSVDVRYAYAVNGQRYTGDRLRIGSESHSTKESAERRLREIRERDILTIYYDPEEPSRSTLYR